VKVKDGAIAENARSLLKDVFGTAGDDDGNGGGSGDGSSPGAVSDSERLKPVAKLLFTD
jgi:hypothetical protein